MTTELTREKFKVIRVVYTPAEIPVFFTPEQLILKVCGAMEMTKDTLCSVTRKREICLPRQILMYIIYNHYSNATLVSTGLLFSNDARTFEHDLVIHSCKVVESGLDAKFGSKLVRDYYSKIMSIVGRDLEMNRVNYPAKCKAQ